MAVKTAEVIFAGNASSLIAAADRAAAASQAAASRVRAAAGEIEGAYTRTGAAATAAGDVAAKAAAKSGASVEAQAKAAGTAAARQAESVKASAGVQARAYASAADAARASAIRANAAQDSMSASASKGTAAIAGFGKKAAVGLLAIVVASEDMALKGEKAAASIAVASGIGEAAGAKIVAAFRGMAEASPAKLGAAFATIAGELKTVEGHALGTAKATEVMKAADNLAIASKGNLTAVTESLGNVMSSYGLRSKQAGEASDVLFNTTRAGGIDLGTLAQSLERVRGRLGTLAPSIKETGAMMLDFKEHSISGRQALSALNGTFTTFLGTGKKTTEMLERLHVHAFTSTGQFVGLRSVIEQLQPKMAKLTKEEQLRAATALFGASAGKQLLGIILAGPKAYDTATTAVSKHGTAAHAAAIQEKTFAGNLKDLRARMEELGEKIGNMLIPVFAKMAKALVEVVDWLKKHATAAKALAGVITGVLATAISVYAYTKAVAFVGATKDMVGAIVGLGKKITGTAAATAAGDGAMVAANTGAGASFMALGLTAVKYLGMIGIAVATAEVALHGLGSALEKVTGEKQAKNLSELFGGTNEGPGHEGEVFAKAHGNFGKDSQGSIGSAARKYGVPESVLRGIWSNETGSGSNVTTSSAGAMGDMQFIPGTAKQYKYPMTNKPTNKQFAEQMNAAAHYMADLIRQNHGNVSAALQQYSGNTPGYAQKALAHHEATEGTETLPGMEALLKKAAKPKIEPYADPFHNATGVHRSRTDQGVDFSFGGSLGAIGSGVITGVKNFQGFGQTVIERLTSGPHKGQYVYTALETGGKAMVGAGAHVRAGQQIAQGFGSGGIEMGWAGPDGLPVTRYGPGQSHNTPTAGGIAFSKFLASIGKGGSGLQIATAEQSTREKAEAIAKKAEEKRRTADLKVGTSQLSKLLGAIHSGGVKELSSVVGGKHDKWLAQLEKTLTGDGTKASVKLEKSLVTVHTRALTHLAAAIKTQWTEAMATVKKSMGELVKQSGEAWRTLQQTAIGKKHEDALKAIKSGPGAELTKMQKEDEAKAAAKEELKLNEELACAKREGNKKRQKETEEAITDFARQQDEKRKGESISVAEETAETEQKVAEEGLDAQTVAYEAMLAKQLAALEAMLAKGELSWDAFKARVFGVTGITPEGAGPGPAPPAAGPKKGEPNTYTNAKGETFRGKESSSEPGSSYTNAKGETFWVNAKEETFRGKASSRAKGGPVYPGVTYKVGELGEETFTPAVAGHITPASQGTSGSSAASVGGVHFSGPVNLGSRRDADRFANKLAFQLVYGGR
jgi:TP901 family phage tail tape measure protein